MSELYRNRSRRSRWMVALGGLAFFTASLVGLWPRITDSGASVVHLVAGLLFSALLLLREKPHRGYPPSRGTLAATAIAGALLAAVGLIAPVRQFEWLGMLLLLHACLRWALPDEARDDIGWALFVLYWVHPLPGQIFAPLQFFLQRAAVAGSEWLLHALRAPAWAEGLWLHTPAGAFEVPEACSGMRTAVTVLLCCLGTSLLYRFTWWRTTVLTALGLLQVLLLNIARITFMVRQSDGSPTDARFLHDSAGLFLLAAVLLVQVEAGLWRMARRNRRRGGIFEEDRKLRGSIAGALTLLLPSRVIATAALLLAAGATAVWLGLAHRPAHRAPLVHATAVGLLQVDPPAAGRAAGAALRLTPGIGAYEATVARALFTEQRFAEALTALDRVPPEARGVDHAMLRAQALVATGDPAEAARYLASLPRALRAEPGLAMARAELAARTGDIEAVVRALPETARSPDLARRSRALHPLLAAHGQWNTIAATDPDIPHTTADALLLAARARQMSRDRDGLARLLAQHAELWRADERFLPLLFALAVDRMEDRWRAAYADTAVACLEHLAPDALYALCPALVRLRRPDALWRLYAHGTLTWPAHPAWLLIPALHGEGWFRFRATDVAGAAASPGEDRDLRETAKPGLRLTGLGLLPNPIPLHAELRASVETRRQHYAKWIAQALAALQPLHASAPTDAGVTSLYADALEAAGRPGEAAAVLEARLAAAPPDAESVRLRLVRLHANAGDWMAAYEAVQPFRVAEAMDSALATPLVEILLRRDMGLAALEEARLAAERWPLQPELRRLEAEVWARHGDAEQALHLLRKHRLVDESPAVAVLLRASGRPAAAERLEARLRVPAPAMPARSAPAWLVPAEAAIQRRPASALATPAEPHEPRDDRERATALHRRAWLLADAGGVAEADAALAQALELFPASPPLWRLRVALAEGRADIVRAARAAVPEDPEIWLAELVMMADGAGDTQRGAAIRAALAARRWPAAALVRAGDLAARHGDWATAAAVATQVTLEEPDYIPGWRLALHVAAQAGDAARTAAVAEQALLRDPNAQPYERLLARLRDPEDRTDPLLVARLRRLLEAEPHETAWGARLGYLLYRRGEWGAAWTVLKAHREAVGDNLGIAAHIVCADAARRAGDAKAGLGILLATRERFPGDVQLANALAYSLAVAGRQPEAEALVPELRPHAEGDAAICDTLALIERLRGDLASARRYAERAVALGVHANEQVRRDLLLNAAETAHAQGARAEARAHLAAARKIALSPDAEFVRVARRIETDAR